MSFYPENDYGFMNARCDNCGHVCGAGDVDPIPTDCLGERLSIGGTTPAGQCPECGCFAYGVDPEAPEQFVPGRVWILATCIDRGMRITSHATKTAAVHALYRDAWGDWRDEDEGGATDDPAEMQRRLENLDGLLWTLELVEA